MSDTIDRQAAIEIVDRYDKSHMILKGKPMLGAASIVIELEALPSAQPKSAEQTAETAQNVSDEDLISRKAAIDAVCKSECGGGFCGIPCPEVDALKALPSAQPKSYREGYQAGFKDAQPERKRGRWLHCRCENGG